MNSTAGVGVWDIPTNAFRAFTKQNVQCLHKGSDGLAVLFTAKAYNASEFGRSGREDEDGLNLLLVQTVLIVSHRRAEPRIYGFVFECREMCLVSFRTVEIPKVSSNL